MTFESLGCETQEPQEIVVSFALAATPALQASLGQLHLPGCSMGTYCDLLQAWPESEFTFTLG